MHHYQCNIQEMALDKADSIATKSLPFQMAFHKKDKSTDTIEIKYVAYLACGHFLHGPILC